MSEEQDVTYVAIDYSKPDSRTHYTIIRNGVSHSHMTTWGSFLFPFITTDDNGDPLVWNIVYSEYDDPRLLTGGDEYLYRDFTEDELYYIESIFDFSLLQYVDPEVGFVYDGIKFDELYVRDGLTIVSADPDLYIYTKSNGRIHSTTTYWYPNDRMHPHAYIATADNTDANNKYLLSCSEKGAGYDIIGFDSYKVGDALEESKEYSYVYVSAKSLTKEYGLILTLHSEYVELRDPLNPHSVSDLFEESEGVEDVSQTVFFTGDDNQTYVVCNYDTSSSPIIRIGRFVGIGQPAKFIQTIGGDLSYPRLIAHPRGVIIKDDDDYSQKYTIYEVDSSGTVVTNEFNPIFPLTADDTDYIHNLEIGIDGKYAFANIFNIPT